MTEKEEQPSMGEWLEKKIDKFKDYRGQITGIYSNMLNTDWSYGSYSWHDLEIKELLAIYEGMQVEWNAFQALRKDFKIILGLPEDAPNEKVVQAVKEMGEFFTEWRRAYGERKARDDIAKP